MGAWGLAPRLAIASISIPNTPLFVKTHDFIVWLLEHSQRFPKGLRQSYTTRLENEAFEFQKATLMANAVRGADRKDWLDRADGHLMCLRALLRFTTDLRLSAISVGSLQPFQPCGQDLDPFLESFQALHESVLCREGVLKLTTFATVRDKRGAIQVEPLDVKSTSRAERL